MTVLILENWAIGYEEPWNGYTAPERRTRVVSGDVYGSKQRPDGTRVTTSRIVGFDGKRVTTASGSVYELGEPRPEYKAYCDEIGVEPLKMLVRR